MISVVIPVYNEEKNVKPLHNELISIFDTLNLPFEIIFINDGSIDGTLDGLKQLHPVRIINFQKCFGQTAAFNAGFKAAKGKTIITMDGDMQNDPHDIPRLLEKFNEGYDVVCGWRNKRKDVFMKRFFSRGARVIRRILLEDNLHDAGCSLRVYKKDALENLDIYGEMHRFIAPILVLRGFKVTEVKINHRPRIHGTTKYDWKRAIKGFVDMVNLWFLYKYRARPLHLFGGLGILIGGAGTFLSIFFFIERVLFAIPLAGRTLPMASLFLVLFGMQLFIMGLLADIMMRNYYNTSKEKSYFIRDSFENQ
ncbi:MAG: glycosyltransferase family 2 protein [Patescibacteria group bacterium]